MSYKKWTAGEIGNQIAHGGMAFLIVLISAMPIISGIIGAFRFAVTREYYQAKITTQEVFNIQNIKSKPKFWNVMMRMNWVKRDLVAAYLGIAFGVPIGIWVFFWLYEKAEPWLSKIEAWF